jgi:hypothetical protein
MVKSGPAVANALFVDAKIKYIITETFTYKEDPNAFYAGRRFLIYKPMRGPNV